MLFVIFIVVVFCVFFLFFCCCCFFGGGGGGGGGGGKCGVHLCCNTCCENMQLINIELALIGDNTYRNRLLTYNLVHRIPGI